MTLVREGALNALQRFNWAQQFRLTVPATRRHVTSGSKYVAANSAKPSSIMAKLEPASSLATTLPQDRRTLRKLRKFNPRGRAIARRYELPGSRYQFHPPTYDRGPLHPVRSPPTSDPTSRQFIPGPFNLPRLKQTYHDTLASDILTLAYTHRIPGEKPDFIPRKYEDRVATWDGSSPYHEGRGHKGPRGSSRLQLLEKPITFTNVPRIEGVALQCYMRTAQKDRDTWVAGWTALRAISGRSPWNIRVKHPVVNWGIQKNHLVGVRTELKGDAAYEFVDKLIHIVLPRIKDWPGLYYTTGDQNGNIQLGLTPKEVAQFPEIIANHDMYPPTKIPGMRISINTSAQSNRHAKLLMQAIGMPFTDKEVERKRRPSML